jgi:hypothetical protein
MKSNTLISVRSNCNFALNYQTGKLNPQTEIILITTNPKYELTKKKDGFTKEHEIQEYRFLSDLKGINQLIGELQLLVTSINSLEQMASSFNAIIDAHKPAAQESDTTKAT